MLFEGSFRAVISFLDFLDSGEKAAVKIKRNNAVGKGLSKYRHFER
jgi:hypothetical protein